MIEGGRKQRMTGDKNQGNGRKGVVAVDKDESVVHTAPLSISSNRCK